MHQSKFTEVCISRLSAAVLFGLLLVSVAQSQTPGSERVIHTPAITQGPTVTPAPAAKPVLQQPVREQRSLPTQHIVVTREGVEAESDTPSELRADPTPGPAGDEWAQQPIPDYLKGNPYRLSYVAGDYTPVQSERIDPALLLYWKNNFRTLDKTYGFVMFQGKITNAKLARVQAMGVKLDKFHTFQCYSAVIPFKCIPALLGSVDVRWIGYAKPSQKIDPELAQMMGSLSVLERSTTKTHLFVNVYESDLGSASEFVQPWALTEKGDEQAQVLPTKMMMSNGTFQKALQAMGARVYVYHDINKVFQIEAPYSLVEQLAKLDWVHAIEPIFPITPDHDRSTRQVAVDRVRSSTATDGSSTIVGLLDSGAFVGKTGHQDLNKLAASWNFNGGLGSVLKEAYGHGTHIMGTIGGTGTANNRYKGCAPAIGTSSFTRLYIGKIFGTSTTKTYPNNTLTAFSIFKSRVLVSGWYTQRPHVINNSWGYGSRSTLGYYGTDNISLGVDNHAYLYGQLYCFSASNTGGSSTAQYLRSMRRPNVSKNALTVASNYDVRKTVGATTVEAGQPTYSSGKGPTRDGRFKPNIMAPGDSIRSCKTLTTTGYTDKGGTSMAAPHVTGILAGMMDHIPALKYNPPLAKAWLASQSNPYASYRSWSSTSNSYYYRQGMGQVDAYKSNYSSNTSRGWTSGYASGYFTAGTSGASFDVIVPADAKRTFFVLNYDEGGTSPSATRAVVADLDMYLDVEGFSSGYNTGEYSSRRAYDSWEWYGHTTNISSVRGKKIRVKIYPRVRPKIGQRVLWGVGYLFVRGAVSTNRANGTITMTSNKTNYQPNETAAITASVRVPSWITTNGLVEMTSSSGYTVTSMRHTSVDGLLRTYTATTLPGLGDSLYNWTLGHVPYFATTTNRLVTWNVRKGINGTSRICIRLRSDNLSTLTGTTVCKTLCVDGLAPKSITGVNSGTHPAGVWKNTGSFFARWSTPVDNGCSGIAGLAYSLTTSSKTVPTTKNITGAATSKALTLTSGKGLYFHLRAVDAVGNKSALTNHYGPIKVDLTKPTVTKVSINGSLTITRSLIVNLAISANDSYSGVSQMRFSGNGSSWTLWTPYTTTSRKFALNSYGGSAAQGTKRIYAQVKDLAGNISSLASGVITYDSTPPLVTAVSIDAGAPYTNASVVNVTSSGSGSPTHTQYSFNGTSWSGWMTYTTTARQINVSSYGGSSAQGKKTMYVRMQDYAGNVSAIRTDTIIYDTVAPAISLVRINGGATHTNLTKLSVVATGSGLPSQMQYSLNGTKWSAWMSYTTGSRSLSMSSYGGNLLQGTKTVYVRLRDAARNQSSTRTDTIVYDSVAPVVTLVRINGGATHTSLTTLNVVVTGSGSPVLVQYSLNGKTWSSWMGYTTGSRSIIMSAYGGNLIPGTKTVYARLRDGAANLSSTRTDTIIYDKSAPSISSVSINSGAAYTNSTTVGVKVLASGNPTQVQYSFNRSTWSAWMTYSTSARTLSVTSYGGNSNTGTKVVYARVRNAAMTLSAIKSDSIVYFKVPTHTASVGTSWTVIHDNKITLTGSGFANVNLAYVGTAPISSTNPEDWHKGYLKVISDTKIEVYPPQNLVPGTYTCYVRNPGYKGAGFATKVVHNTTSKTAVPPTLKSGNVLHVYTHRGPKPATTISVLTFSVSSKPLILPGLVSLGHGGNVATYIDPSFTIITPSLLHNAATRTAHWAFPTPSGKIAGVLYWQSVMFDATKPTQSPIPVSTTDFVKFYK